MCKKNWYSSLSIIVFSVFLSYYSCAYSQYSQFTERNANKTIQIVDEQEVESLFIPKKIGLLLPISGPWANTGNAIKRGFFSAFYQDPRSYPKPIIHIWDTYHKDISSIYQQAIEDGCDFIVGPLTKSNLIQLIQKNTISLPTLALNTVTENQMITKHLFQFGLSPADEARQLATVAMSHQQNKVIMISPQSAWGDHVADSFRTELEINGAEVIKHLHYNQRTNLNSSISQLLNLDRSKQRAREIKHLLQENFRFIPRRRQDIDAIFIVANSADAHQIIPLLKFNYAGELPTYTISTAYSQSFSKTNTVVDRDLNHVIFTDIPWILTPHQLLTPLLNLQMLIKQSWPMQYKHYARLYALGIDAYFIIAQLNWLQESTDHKTQGATGLLSLQINHHLKRTLKLAKMIKGRPVLLKQKI